MGRAGRTRALVALAAVAAGVASHGLFAQTASSSGRVTVARLEVRVEPNEASGPIGAVSYGQVLPILGSAAGWAHVRVFVGSTLVDGYVPQTMIAPAPVSAPIDARLQAEAAVRLPGATAGSGVAVALDANGKTQWIKAVVTRAVPILRQTGGLEGVATAPGLAVALEGGTVLPADRSALVTWVWVVDEGDVVTVSAARPLITTLYSDVPGVRPDAVMPALVRLVAVLPRWRLLLAAPGRADAPLRDVADWTLADALDERRMGGATLDGGNGQMKTRLAGPLEPGEYAVVLRPTGSRPSTGSQVFGGSALAAGEAVLYGQVFPFRVS
jgi:hypothetical protein